MNEIKLDEAALEAAFAVAYERNELWAKTQGSPTDVAVRSILTAYLSALPDPVGEGELVERVARAVAHNQGEEWQGDVPPELQSRAWSDIRDNLLSMAQAAIAAMPAHLRTGVPDGWRPEVRAFADLMEAQLRANDHKPGWKEDNAFALLERLREETEELNRAMYAHDGLEEFQQRIALEAADVANFAMMIADVYATLPIPNTDGES